MKTSLRCILMLLVWTLTAATGFAESAAPAEITAPVTTGDPGIPVDHLDLLLDPLTKGELLAEANAWRDLLKKKVQEISAEEIQLRKKNAQIADHEANGKLTTSTEAKLEGQKDANLENLNRLREEKTALLERLETVLAAYKKKGGDTEEFDKYATAVSGIKVEVTDTSATWAAVRGWALSKEGGIKWAERALQLAIIMVVFWLFAKAFGSLVRKATDRSPRMSGLLKSFVNKFIERVVLFIGLMVALSTLGVEVGALLALVGGGAFILGFALQDTLGNFAAGLMLLFYRPFDVGDVVEVGGVAGQVDNVSLVNTTIRSADNKLVLVPNKQVWGQVITNATASDQRRVDMTFGIGYDDNVDDVRAMIENILKDHPMVLQNPAPVVELNTLGEYSVEIICRPWTRTENYWRLYWDITKQVKHAFAEAGITTPYPQRDVYVHQVAVEALKSRPGAGAFSSTRSANQPIRDPAIEVPGD